MIQNSWKIFSSDAPIIVQGMTGKEGVRMTKWLRQSGVRVVAGVTPGKGGQIVEDCPIFNRVVEARAAFPEVELTSIVVPAVRVRGAVEEALAAGIKYIQILTESVPVHDVLVMRKQAALHGAVLLGPSSIGYLQFPAFRVGYIGGENPFQILKEGDVALVSTSGGMINELMMGLGRHEIGVRVALAVGGDRVPGMLLEEALAFCDGLPNVKKLVVFSEPGRPFFHQLLQGNLTYAKPLIVFLVGDVLDDLPRGKAYGHTGTLLQEEEQSVAGLRTALRDKGIVCVASLGELVQALQ